MIICGDALEVLRTLPDEHVQCCVTSPPYWGLRDYGVAGQMGLETTPEEYVGRMVEVFRKVRRVLRKDGTLWLNLGDSYVSGVGTGHQGKHGQRATRTHTQRQILSSAGVSGLKPKDLLGIPWRVARALQEPYYTGSIKDERDRIWLAAMLDAEGCIFIHRRKAGQHNGQGYYRQSDNFAPGVEIANTSLAVAERVIKLVGKGTICSQGPEQNGRRRQVLYRWNLRTTECRDFVREVYPYLVAKQQQARIMCGCPSSGEAASTAHRALIGLHNGIPTDIDFAAPISMLEPGYYLRSDIIWSKSNPMPESVTDRPTKAHEYLFLLAKSEKYYYDHEAIKEPFQTDAKENYPARARITGRGDQDAAAARGNDRGKSGGFPPAPGGRNRRDVWTIATKPYRGAHFATFPPKLIEPCILAGCPQDGIVLDPFAGAGTTGVVATQTGRRFLGIELNPTYVEMALARIDLAIKPLLSVA